MKSDNRKKNVNIEPHLRRNDKTWAAIYGLREKAFKKRTSQNNALEVMFAVRLSRPPLKRGRKESLSSGNEDNANWSALAAPPLLLVGSIRNQFNLCVFVLLLICKLNTLSVFPSPPVQNATVAGRRLELEATRRWCSFRRTKSHWKRDVLWRLEVAQCAIGHRCQSIQLTLIKRCRCVFMDFRPTHPLILVQHPPTPTSLFEWVWVPLAGHVFDEMCVCRKINKIHTTKWRKMNVRLVKAFCGPAA